jgi:type IV pilus assembly protein PilM
MRGSKQNSKRPRLACEIMVDRVIAARASDKGPRLEVFTSRRLSEGALAPGLTGPNVMDGKALRSAISGALGAVGGNSRDVIVIVPDAAIRVLLLDFETLPARAQETDPVIRLRLKKSLPFDVDQASVSYDIRRHNGTVQAVAAVSPRSVIEEYETAFRDLGYSPGVVLPSTVAALGTVDAEKPTLLVKVDPGNVMIIAAEKHELRLVRTLENPRGAAITPEELAEGVLPSVVFFEDTFGARIEQIFVGGVASLQTIGPLLHQQTGAQVQELGPSLSSEQDLSGENLEPAMMAGIAGALLG